jgi:UDP-N-acetylmuramate--alanine ligase
MIGTLLTESDLDPTVIVGGRLRISGTGARLGRSVFMVAEADEFDRSFLHLSPIIAVITSLELDHHDTYRDLGDVSEAFVRFARGVPFFGRVIVCLDDPNLQSVLPLLRERRLLTYGLSPQADLSAYQVREEGSRSRFRVRHSRHGDLGEVGVPLPGLHNVQNALATVAVGLTLDLSRKAIKDGLAAFSGVHRRFERLGLFQGAEVVDDYAHHPSEVSATLSAARQAFGSGDLFAVFQPHLYSRTQYLAEDFGRSLLAADRALVTEVYGSRETPIPGVSGRMVVDAARRAGHRKAEFVSDWSDALSLLRDEVRPGDVVLTLGAGDIFRLAHELVGKGDE